MVIKIHRAIHPEKVYFTLHKLYFSKLTLNPSDSCSIWCHFKGDLEVYLSKTLVECGKMKKEI